MYLQVEIAGSISIADTFDDFSQAAVNIGIFTVFHPGSDKVTQNPPEIVMAGIAEEGAGVGEHANEITQKSQIAKGFHLLFHAGFVVIEPPGGAVLDLAGDGTVLEAADEGAQLGVVGRIERIQNGLGAAAGFIQIGKQLGNVAAAGVLGNGIHAGIGALGPENPLVVVAQAGVVQLHGDV